MLTAAFNNLTSFVSGESRVKRLTELYLALIDLCLNQSKAEEQNALAREIDSLLNSATAKLPALYDFLTVTTSRKKKSTKRRKKHSSKSSDTAKTPSAAAGSASRPITSKSKATIRKSPRQKPPKTSASRRRLNSADGTSSAGATPRRPRRYSTNTFSSVERPVDTFVVPSTSTAAAMPANRPNPLTQHTPSTSAGSTTSSSSSSALAYGIAVIEFEKSPATAGTVTKTNRLQNLLKAIELSADEMSVMMLCKLLEGYCTMAPTASQRTRRLRQMSRLDAANPLLRSIRQRLSDPDPRPFTVAATEYLITTTVRVCAKDTKFLLKIRLSGLVQVLSLRLLEVDRIHCTLVLLRFACRALKSPRNSQLMGRDRQFAERFTNVLVAYNAIECADCVPPYVPRTTNPDAYTAADKMARLVEILFYVTKNRKNKLYLIDQGVISIVKSIFESHFQRRALDSVHWEIALIAIAVIRHLSKSRKGKEEVSSLHILEMCETSIAQLTDDRVKYASKKTILANCTQLQDSLCALCIRCLPQLPFPYKADGFPLMFPIPADIPSTSTPVGVITRSKHGSLRTTPKSPSTSAIGSPMGPSAASTPIRKGKSLDQDSPNAANEELDSEEDAGDEEEDSFMGFSNAGNKLLMSGANVSAGGSGANASFTAADDEDPDDQMNSDDDDDRGLTGHGVTGANALPKYSRQKPGELKERYGPMFHEFHDGALIRPVLHPASPKLRRTVFGAVPPVNSDPQEPNAVPEMDAEPPAPSDSAAAYRERILRLSRQTRSVAPFVKIAFPELADPNVDLERRDLLQNQESMRETVVQKMAKARVQQQNAKTRVVFDLDEMHRHSGAARMSASALRAAAAAPRRVSPSASTSTQPLGNNDLERCGRFVADADHLLFESRFESGNLRAAIQITENHYELVLSPDINEARPHYQWFYFEVSNNQPNVAYTFEIINCLKNTSMFSKGMQPVMFSVTEARNGRPGWVRAGSSVCYYRNLYVPPGVDENKKPAAAVTPANVTPKKTPNSTPNKSKAEKEKNAAAEKTEKSYFSIRFTMRFRHAADVCYIAYHYPYTYSYLQSTLEMVMNRCHTNPNNTYVRVDKLTQTLAENPVPLLTVTAAGTAEELRQRPLVLLMARVHPGESNSSWIMHGIIQTLTANTDIAARLRQRFVFKIVPFLNPDGVINGSHRCSLAGIDLNRVWDRPSTSRHPTVFHAKGLVQYMVDILKRPPLCIVDLHGHSRKSNVFTYGNNPEESWRQQDQTLPHSGQVQILPELLDRLGEGFALKDCRFSITKAKEPSARITLWRQFAVERCYTMESTYCGFDAGAYAGKQIGIADLKRMGEHLCQVMIGVHEASLQPGSSSSTTAAEAKV